MSTICCIDPLVRMTRTERASTLRSLADAIPRVADAHKRLEATMVHGYLTEVHDNPTLTGTQKSDEFKRVIKHLQERNDGAPAVQSAA